MGSLVKEIKHSTITSLLERLDCKDVEVSHLKRVLKDDAFRDDLSAFLRGERELAPMPSWVTPISEADVPAHLQKTHTAWVLMATREFGYDGPVAFRVKAGFNLRKHTLQYDGPCLEKRAYMKGCELKNDESTLDSIVFWIPALVPGSTSKSAVEQQALLASLREKYELTAHHLTSFGSASLSAALILGHYAFTKKRVPEDCYWVRTDTLRLDGRRLYLGYFTENGLDCGNWCRDDQGDDILGCMALGVEKA